ncbi:MAG: hypothetical protein IH934_08035 [Nanoarchaeota archaeon]|nr:hypothetical protein [Nanoarchaeota archaeon]
MVGDNGNLMDELMRIPFYVHYKVDNPDNLPILEERVDRFLDSYAMEYATGTKEGSVDLLASFGPFPESDQPLGPPDKRRYHVELQFINSGFDGISRHNPNADGILNIVKRNPDWGYIGVTIGDTNYELKFGRADASVLTLGLPKRNLIDKALMGYGQTLHMHQ